jgi:hypothetical protein
MGNIVRWFEDFPRRALDLLQVMKAIAAERDRIGSLSLLIAPALIVAPYERLQTHARRKNPQADYLRFPDAHQQFNSVMDSPFRDAEFWDPSTKKSVMDWRGGQVARITNDPAGWETHGGHKPWQAEFWSVDVSVQQTRWVWKFLRDALSHWNVATADRLHRSFDEDGTMQRLLFYRARDDKGPWDIVSVSPEAFFAFLEAWTAFLSQGLASKLLAESEAA